MDVLSGLKIVDRPREFLHPHDDVVLVANGHVLQIRFQIVLPFIRALVDRKDQRTTTLGDEVQAIVDESRVECALMNSIGTGKENDGLQRSHIVLG